MLKKETQKGFTLIELLVVIAIIALLSSVVMASITKARQTAEIRKFEQELINIRTAIQLYREKNNGAWPPFTSYTHINNLLPKLVAAGVYNKSKLDVLDGFYVNSSYPNGYVYFWPGYKINTTSYYSCGGANHQDVYWTLVVLISDSNLRGLTTLPKGYHTTNSSHHGGNRYCLEIR